MTSPHVDITPPRATFLLTVHLQVGPNSFRAFTTESSDPTVWLARWEEDWREVAGELWDYEPWTGASLPPPTASIADVLGLKKAQVNRRV